MCLGQHRIEGERRFELRDGKLGLAEVSVRNRQMAANRGVARVRLHGTHERRQCALRILESQAQDADGVQSVGIVRQVRLQSLEGRGRAAAISGVERFERAREEPAVERRASGRQRGQASLLFTHGKASIGTWFRGGTASRLHEGRQAEPGANIMRPRAGSGPCNRLPLPEPRPRKRVRSACGHMIGSTAKPRRNAWIAANARCWSPESPRSPR